MRSRSSRAFTLIELLVVIAIVAILAAILFPVITKARERARQTRCLANLKQLAVACRMYADENHGYSPNPAFVVRTPDWEGLQTWRGRVVPQKGQIWQYVRNAGVYECPSDVGLPALDVVPYQQQGTEMYDYASKHYGLSYSMNHLFIDASTKQTLLLDSVRRPKETLYLIHESRKTINDGGYNWSTYDDPDSTHWDGTTVVYVDCHAVWKPTVQLRQEKLQKLPDGKHYLWDPNY